MTARRCRYSVGNEHDPGDPYGTASLHHRFPVTPGAHGWTGQVQPAALRALAGALARAGFPDWLPGPASRTGRRRPRRPDPRCAG
ncbi:hypothetical protein [Actinoplanes sp. NPDC049599]|uniref:hypothetical protein n=1 Tax=Actinoplanes sp. NPDC049599 TaxID=3363903 RepID=UPI003793AA96